VSDHGARIEELWRRVQSDPASIAFAQLAEELRRAGDFDEAVRVCRAGLDIHSGYLSARVTLGRALAARGRDEEARVEFAQVLRAAPDNLVAIRSMADLHQRRDDTPPTASAAGEAPESSAPAPEDPAVEVLEHWLAAILVDRDEKGP
jgi:Flp pilus assembly protein TadD